MGATGVTCGTWGAEGPLLSPHQSLRSAPLAASSKGHKSKTIQAIGEKNLILQLGLHAGIRILHSSGNLRKWVKTCFFLNGKSWRDAPVHWQLPPRCSGLWREGGGSGSGNLGWLKSVTCCSPGWKAPGTQEGSALDKGFFFFN